MAPRDLRSFIARLQAAGQLVRVRAEVSTDLEIAEIAGRLIARGGPAALFENVAGHTMPVLVGAFGSMERMAWALGAESLEAIAERVGRLAASVPLAGGAGLAAKMKALPKLLELARLRPKTVPSGPCQEVVRTGDEASLARLPILRSWPGDAGPFITLPQVYTADPDGKNRNVGMYRLQVFGPRRLGMHWHADHDGARNWRAWAERGRAMPVAVALGGDPVLTYVATAPLPYGMDELVFAGFLRDEAVAVVPCKTVALVVPADAEIVIEGTVESGERAREGPFGDHTGYYTPADEYPVMRVSAVTHRADAVYPATVVGRFPKEDCYLAKATERIFLPVIRTVVPEVVDLALPLFGVFHNWAFVSIRKHRPGQAREVMRALWGMGQLAYTKFLVIVDESVNVHDTEEVLWRVGAEADPRRDTVLETGRADVLDHAAPSGGEGGKLGIDATRKLPQEVGGRAWPEPLAPDPDTAARVTRRWREYGFE
ncbi:MAG TPA: menaquinone biosynthesis decarboxylase [Phycisphaerae bacterium]|nr:menaquinone biosynthesis decarboxylase [Phycisphaerae bacterium]